MRLDPAAVLRAAREEIAFRAVKAEQGLVKAAEPKCGCLMAMLPSLDSTLPNWAADNIPSDCLHEEGIETEPHVTVLYGFNLEFESSKIAEVLSQALGGARFAVPQEQGSVGFPAGHWRQYAQALAGPFATLTPVAVRLGYPEA